MASAQLTAPQGLAAPGGASGSPSPPPSPRGGSRPSRKKSKKSKDKERSKKDKSERKARKKLEKKFEGLELRLLSQMSGLLAQWQLPPGGTGQQGEGQTSPPQQAGDSPPRSRDPSPAGSQRAPSPASHPGDARPATVSPVPPDVSELDEDEIGVAHQDSFSTYSGQDTPRDSFLVPEEAPPHALARVAGLEDFALTGIAPAFSQPRKTGGPSDLQARMWVTARGGELLQRVPVDKLELNYKVGSGPFQAPPLPRGLLSDRAALEADETMRAVQQQWGTVGQAVTKSLARIEEIVKSLQEKASLSASVSSQDICELAKELSGEAVRPLSHVLRLSASRFNSHQARRKDRVQSVIAKYDFALGQAVKEAPLATSTFFTEDMTPHIKEAQARRANRDMLRAVQGHGPRRQGPYDRPSSGQGPHPRRGAPPSTFTRGRGQQASQPFRRGRPGQGQRGRHHTPSTGRGTGRAGGPTKE